MPTAANQMMLREQAYRDFCNLEAQGIKPNPNALYEYYIALNKEHPEIRASIPTTNRSTVYEWAREDRWKERYAEKKLAEADVRAEKYDKVRENAFGRMVSFQHDALDTILQLAQNAKDEKVRLQAAESILERTGLGKIAAKQKPMVTEKPEVHDEDALPEDATDQQIVEWLSRSTGSSLNA